MLGVFKEAILLLEYRDQPTISWLFITVNGLLQFLDGVEDDNPNVKKMRDILITQINKRFAYVFDEELFLVASFLDPATTFVLTNEESSKARTILIKWIGKMDYDCVTGDTEIGNQPAKKKTRLSDILSSRSQIKPVPGKDEDIAAIDAYIERVGSAFSQLEETPYSGVRILILFSANLENFSEAWRRSTTFAHKMLASLKFIKLLERSWQYNQQMHRLRVSFRLPAFLHVCTSRARNLSC